MKKLLNLFLPLLILAACGMNETSSEENTPTSNKTYFTEFMPCEAGPDFNSENMTKMISEWQKLLTAEDLVGVWGYAPASEENSAGNTGWWEIQWASEDAADSAWEEWVENEEAIAWQEKYASVLQCNGESRNAFDSVFPIASDTYGELPETGYFYSNVYICELNDGSSKEDAIGFLSGFADAVSEADYSKTSYHFGNYFSHSDPSMFLWGDFTNSEEAMKKVSASFEASVREKMFPLFSQFASCGEQVDKYNGYTLYWAADKEFMPTFQSN